MIEIINLTKILIFFLEMVIVLTEKLLRTFSLNSLMILLTVADNESRVVFMS